MSDSLAVLLPGFDGPVLPGWLAELLDEGLGGVCLFGTNVEDHEQLTALTAALHRRGDPIVAIDEEGGDVTRLYQRTGSPFPGNAILGRLDDTTLTAAVARQVGWELRSVGVDMTFAPDVDVNSNPLNPVIGVRSFGDRPGVVARHGAAWIEAIQSTGIAACAKHFPGHGDTAQDSHHALPVVGVDAQTLMTRDVPPFEAAIGADVRSVMTSHILVPDLDAREPATFSRAMLEGLLRGKLGFTGVIVSDALDMAGASGERGIPAAAVAALVAGADLLCIGTSNTEEQLRDIAAAIDRAVAEGVLEEVRLADAASRVRSLAALLRADRGDASLPEGFTRGHVDGLDPSRLLPAFAISEAAASLIERSSSRPLSWLQLSPIDNMAVGPSPWGPFGPKGVQPAATLKHGDDASAWLAAAGDGLPVIVGKDNHRHDFAREAIALARSRGECLVVDMGWPSAGREWADIATYGASCLVGEALLARMER